MKGVWVQPVCIVFSLLLLYYGPDVSLIKLCNQTGYGTFTDQYQDVQSTYHAGLQWWWAVVLRWSSGSAHADGNIKYLLRHVRKATIYSSVMLIMYIVGICECIRGGTMCFPPNIFQRSTEPDNSHFSVYNQLNIPFLNTLAEPPSLLFSQC